MNYSAMKPFDIANGEGVRVSLFVSGCTHHCKGCFNESTWPFDSGEPFTPEVEDNILSLLEPEHIQGLSLLGGEPFEPQNQAVLAPFLKRVRELFPQKDVWCYTGFNFEDLPPEAEPLLENIDVLIDGAFIENLRDLELQFRGSSNQRIIDIKKTREQKKIVLWSEEI